MKVAVITPSWRTPTAWLEQCVDSVAQQTIPCTHFLVCDGDVTGNAALPLGIQVLRLPRPHADAGNAARAIGSISAIAQGFDALAYLDADNWYEPDHLRLLCEAQQQTGAAVCSSGRLLHYPSGELLSPCPEVDGEQFVASNCLLLTRAAFGLVSAWYLRPYSTAPDSARALWQAIRDAGFLRTHHGQPTVHCRTRDLAHYRHFGKEPPADARSGVVPPHPPTPSPTAGRGGEERLSYSPLPAEGEGLGVRGPSTRPRISLCMIVKDEANHLADCLRPVLGLVDEAVVVDTGSSDATREIARALGARVVDFPWVDSFAAARNEALHHATGDWVFSLDADDRLDTANCNRLQRLFGMLSAENRAYLMKQWSVPDEANGSALVADHVRLFRKQPGITWRYRVHEQILPALRAAGAQFVLTDLVIHHLGYREANVRRQKLARNLRLLLLEAQEQPDEPFTLFNLAATYLDLGESATALPYLHHCLKTAPAGATFLPRAYVLLIQTQRTLGRLEEGLHNCRAGRERFPHDMELCFEEGLLRQAGNDVAGAQQCFERILQLPPGPCYVGVDAGLRGHLTRHQLALALRAQGRLTEAEAQWRAAVDACPQYGPAWLGLAELYLQQKRDAEVEALVERLRQDSQAGQVVAALRARLCLAHGNYTMARRLLEEALQQAAQSLWLRLLLGEVLLLTGQDLEEAERHLSAVVAVDPRHKRARERLQQVRQRRAETPSPFSGQQA